MAYITTSDVRCALRKVQDEKVRALVNDNMVVEDLTKMLDMAIVVYHESVEEQQAAESRGRRFGEISDATGRNLRPMPAPRQSGAKRAVNEAGGLRSVALRLARFAHTIVQSGFDAYQYGSRNRAYNPRAFVISLTFNQAQKIMGAGTLLTKSSCMVASSQLALSVASTAAVGLVTGGAGLVVGAAFILMDAAEVMKSCA